MLVMDDVDEEEEEELPEDDELTIGGGFDGFPFEVIGFVDELPASFSWFWVLLSSFGDVWGLWTFSPRVSVKLLLNAWIDDSARLKSKSCNDETFIRMNDQVH